MVTSHQVASAARKRKRRQRTRSKVLRLFWTMSEVAVALGWSVEATRDKFRAADGALRIGRLWYTSRGKLRRMFPDDWEDIVARLPS